MITKPIKWHVRPAMTQISLGIRQSAQSLCCPYEEARVLSYTLSTHCSDCADAQADLSLRSAHYHFFFFFVVRRLIILNDALPV